MKKEALVIVLAIAAIGAIGWMRYEYIVNLSVNAPSQTINPLVKPDTLPVSPQPSTGTILDTVYKNDAYGFEFRYPHGLPVETKFQKTYTLSGAWRVNVDSDSKGNAIVAIPIFRIDQGGVATGKSYPLSFDAEVRVAASSNPKEVADCYKTDPGYTSQVVKDEVINGVTYKKFEFSDAATMHYLQGVSYRIVRNNICLAIEQVKSGTIYRDETMLPGIPDSQLDNYYQQAGDIIKTFKFTK